ncbi:MAG: hypothetical protein ACOC2G_03405 [Bacillota bacterium]
MHKNYTVRVFISFIFFLIFFLPVEFIKANSDYVLQGEEIHYNYQKELLGANQDVYLALEDLELWADEITLSFPDDLLEAQGEVVLKTEDQEISGKYLTYDLKKGSGALHQAESDIGELHFSGGVINVFSDREYKLLLEQSNFTPCRLPDPHYQIKASEIRIFPQNRLVGKEIEFWWADNKIITLPGYVINYEEVDGEFKFSHPFPVPRLGYNSSEGLTAEVNYPFQVGEKHQGLFQADVSQNGASTLQVSNSWQPVSFPEIVTEMSYDRGRKFAYDFYGGLSGEPVNNWRLKSGVNYQQADEITGGEKNREFIFKNSLAYKKSGYNFAGQLNHYFVEQKTRGKIDLALKKNQYSFSLKSGHVFGGATTGQILLTRGLTENSQLDLEYNYPSKKGTLKFRAAKNFVYSNLQNELTGTVQYIFTDPGPVKTKQSLNLDSKYTFKHEWGEDFDFKADLLLEQSLDAENFSSLANYEVALKPDFFLEIATPEPYSFWKIGAEVDYDLREDSWDKISAGISREYDCFGWGFNYDIKNDIIEFNVNF